MTSHKPRLTYDQGDNNRYDADGGDFESDLSVAQMRAAMHSNTARPGEIVYFSSNCSSFSFRGCLVFNAV